MRRLTIAAVALMVVGLMAGGAQAQTLTNPSRVEFTSSADHAQLTKYVIGYFAPGATSPVMESDLPLGTPDANQLVTATINARPLSFGAAYVAKVRAVAGTMTSEWSEASNPFDRVPMPPTAPVIKK